MGVCSSNSQIQVSPSSPHTLQCLQFTFHSHTHHFIETSCLSRQLTSSMSNPVTISGLFLPPHFSVFITTGSLCSTWHYRLLPPRNGLPGSPATRVSLPWSGHTPVSLYSQFLRPVGLFFSTRFWLSWKSLPRAISNTLKAVTST